jgi:hypothetical protein
MAAAGIEPRAKVTEPTEEWTGVAQHGERTERWLAGDADTRPLRLTKIHTLLVRDHGLRDSLTSRCVRPLTAAPRPRAGDSRRG